MTENQQHWFQQRFFKIAIGCIVALLVLARIGYGYGQAQTTTNKQTILQGSLHIQPTQPVQDDLTNKIQPGTAVKIGVMVENKGQQASSAGQLYVRYAFANPLQDEPESVIFETEKKPLPPLEPGKKVKVIFNTPHKIPSLLDFVRHDWSIREYQAIAVVNDEDYMIGTLAITFSAYYYPGIKKEFPIEIASSSKNSE